MKVLINYHYLAFYRLGVVNCLRESKKGIFLFSAGSTPNIDIRLIAQKEIDYTFANFWIRNLCYQRFPFSLLKKFDAVVFLGNPNLIYVWIILLYNRIFKRTKIVLWTHGYYENDRPLIRLIRNCFYKLSHGVMFYNDYAATLGSRNLNIPTKAIYNSLPNYQYIFDNFSEELLIRRKASSVMKLVYIGRLTKSKNIAYYLECCLKLGRKVEFHIIGDGPEYKTLEEVACKYRNRARIKLYGELFNETEISEVLSYSHMCITPVNVGLTAIHAMSYGIPVFSCRDRSLHGPEFEAVLSANIPIGFDDMGSFETELRKAMLYLDSNMSLVVKACRTVIKKKWNPIFQAATIEAFVAGIVGEK